MLLWAIGLAVVSGLLLVVWMNSYFNQHYADSKLDLESREFMAEFFKEKGVRYADNFKDIKSTILYMGALFCFVCLVFCVWKSDWRQILAYIYFALCWPVILTGSDVVRREIDRQWGDRSKMYIKTLLGPCQRVDNALYAYVLILGIASIYLAMKA